MRLFFVIFVAALLSGCTHYAPPGENHPVRVVTEVEVIATQDGNLRHYHYNDAEKVKAVLQYLRKLKPLYYSAITPDTFRTDAYKIVLSLSDGTKTVYHQIYDSYLQKNNGPWQSIDSVSGSTLPQLLKLLPSDSCKNDNSAV